jgi:hypothetical protein
MARPPTPELSSSPHPPRPKVIYIMGAGRSGSTILGVTLGNCENVFFAGEVDKWLLRSGKPTQNDSERTRFWEAVGERVEDPEPLFGSAAHHNLERSSSLFRVRARSVRRRMRGGYRRLAEELYRAIAVTAGVTHVIDSSHYPLRAHELQALEGIDLHLVLLVRDPRSVLASFAREDVTEPRFNALKTNAYLWLTNLLSVWVFLKHPPDRRLLLRHEDFLADPEGVLGSVLEHVGSPSPIPDLTSLNTGLPLQGNRLIAEKVVSLERRGSSSPRASALKSLPQLPWTVVFSRLRPRATSGRSTPLASASTPARL